MRFFFTTFHQHGGSVLPVLNASFQRGKNVKGEGGSHMTTTWRRVGWVEVYPTLLWLHIVLWTLG